MHINDAVAALRKQCKDTLHLSATILQDREVQIESRTSGCVCIASIREQPQQFLLDVLVVVSAVLGTYTCRTELCRAEQSRVGQSKVEQEWSRAE
jgi:hypothetical protein